jgi:hypothetical protein
LGGWKADIDKRWYYRIGYCPVVFDNEFAVATGLLLPGFSKTREYHDLKASDIPFNEKSRLLCLASDLEHRNVFEEGHLDVIKWFHHNSVPQLVSFEQEVFIGDKYLGNARGNRKAVPKDE